MPEGVGYGPQNTASVGLELNVIGDHAYAYTGLHASNTTAFTVLSFNSGNYLFVGEFQLNGAIDDDSPADIQQTSALIKFNGIGVALLTAGNGAIDAPMSALQPLIIPPFTEVTVDFDMDGTSADRYASGSLTGRIYK